MHTKISRRSLPSLVTLVTLALTACDDDHDFSADDGPEQLFDTGVDPDYGDDDQRTGVGGTDIEALKIGTDPPEFANDELLSGVGHIRRSEASEAVDAGGAQEATTHVRADISRLFEELSDDVVRISLPSGVVVSDPEGLRRDARELVLAHRETVAELVTAGENNWKVDGPALDIAFAGRAPVTEVERFGQPNAKRSGDLGDSMAVRLIEDRERISKPGESTWVGANAGTGHEFVITFRGGSLGDIARKAYADGVHLGDNLDGLDESPEPEEVLETGGEFDGEAQSARRGWSNGIDSRALQGSTNVAFTDNTREKMVSLGQGGGCSGTMIGPKHIATAGHCIRDMANSGWNSGMAYAGRNGTAQRASVSFVGSGPVQNHNAWYYVPGTFMTLTNGQSAMPFSAVPYDFAVVVTHAGRMGEVCTSGNCVGWTGWWYTSSDSGLDALHLRNYGYPASWAGGYPASANGTSTQLWSDPSDCDGKNFTSSDGAGYNRRFDVSCDLSGGHSGSSLTSSFSGCSLCTMAVVSWEYCVGSGCSSSHPNVVVRITKEYSDAIAWLRSTFP